MKQTLFSALRLGSLACLLVLHLCTVTASRAAILAGPITNTANGHIYYLLSPTNWPSAEAEAVSLHGHLATINDEEENTWVFNRFATNGGVARNLWLGLNDAAQEGNWVWVSGEAAAYRKWAPGEPNSGGGFFPDEDQALMRGPALSSPGSWNDAPGDQVHTPVVELGIAAPPANTGAYDVASGFSTNSNPNGAWSYGSSAILGAPITLFSERGNWAGLNYWRAPILLGVPGVYHNPANISVTNSTGTAILGPGQLSFYPGPNGEFCIIRFTAPTNGLYQVSGAFTGVDPHGTITDVHVLVNGVIFNGSVNGYGAGSGPTFNLIVDFDAGDPIDFVVGRSANSQFSFDSTGLSVQISTSNTPPAGIPPTITSQPQSRTVNAGTNVTFFVTATGTTPLSYQWRRNGTNLAGATGTSLTLSNVQPANAGTYSVRVTNAFGAVTSSNAVLTILSPSTNCVSAPTGLVSWWRAEGNASDAVDGNHGTLLNGATFGAGRAGQGFSLDGVDDRVVVADSPSLKFSTNDFAIEGWIQAFPATNSFGVVAILDKHQTPAPDRAVGIQFYLQDGRLSFFMADAPLQPYAYSRYDSASPNLQDGQFHHVAVTVQRQSSTGGKLYVDGQVVLTFDPTREPGDLSNTEALRIGNHANPSLNCFFKGTIDEVTVYDRSLGSNEIAAIYAAASAGKCPPPTGIPPTITSQPQSRTVNAGTNVTFFATATGTTPLSYQWRRNTTNLTGATGTSLTLSNVQPANAGTYSVRVTNAFGSVISSNAVLTVLAPATNCVSAPTGLISWWRAESNAVDSVDSNHGTLAGNATFGGGRVGQGFVFDGNGDGVRIGNPTNLQLQAFTIEAWVRRASSSAITLGGASSAEFLCYGAGGYAFGFLNDGRLFLSKVEIDQTQTPVGVGITDTNFHHVAVTKSGSNVIFYVDGTAYPVPPYNTTYTFATPAAIGARGDNLTSSFYGRIDELAIYNRALSASEVQGVYNAEGFGKCAPPAGIPPAITSQPQSRTVNAGTNVTFFVTATGTAPLSYQWRRNETNLAGATGTSLTLSNVQPANAASYSVRVTNAFGAVTSSNAVLTVLLPLTNCAPPPSGLVSWWPAENNANDIVDGNHGTLQAVTFAAGKVGQAFEFNGTTSFISVPASANLNVGIGSGFAVEGWINPSTLALQRPIVEWNSGSGPNPYGAHFWISAVAGGGPGCLFANLVDTLGVEHFLTSVGGLLVTNSFQHVALTYDKSSGVARLYLNGIMVAQSNLGTFTPQTSYELSLGRRTVGFSQANHWAGKLDEIAIYNRALGSNEIAAIYVAGNAGKCPPPTGIPPTITSQPQSRTVNVGTNVTFFVTATGTAPLSYQWRRNETNLPGATGASLTLSNVQPANAGNYSVRVTNAFGSIISSNAVLTVLSPPSPILAGPITNPANGHIFFLIASNTWTGAEAQSVSLGGHLVTINDAAENAWVLSTFGNFGGLARPLWIGLNDAALESAFVWASGEAASYRNWMPGEPNNGGGFVPDEDYVALRGPGLSFSNAWNDTLNSDLYVGVVEIGSTVSSTNCVIAPGGLVSWWRAESNAVDSVDSNHGTLTGNATFGVGRVGRGFVFDGSGDAVSLGSATNLQLQTFTIEAWIKRASTSVSSGSSPIFANLFAYGVGGYGLGLQSNGRLYLSKIEISDVGIINAVTDTNWHHVAVTKAGSSVLFYVDGLAYTAPAYDPTFTFSSAVAIGARGDDLSASFLGAIDELAVYNRALGSNEIAAIYVAGSAGKCPPPAGIPPTITFQPQSQTVNSGTNVSFFVTATGTAPLSYQWRRNATNLAGATGSSLTLTNVQATNAGTYSVRVTNAFGVAISSNALLTVALAAYDVSANYSLAANPNGVWRYGALSNLAGPLTLLTSSRTFGADNGVPIGEWNPGGVLHPHVNKVLGPGTAVSAGGAFVGPAGTVYFTPGEDETAYNFGVIRFTVPAGGTGNYRIVTAVQPLFDGALSADADFHVDKNGVQLFGAALGPNQGTSYSNTVTLAAGDTIDFAIGRGADGILGTTGLKIQATLAQVAGTSGGTLGFPSLVREPGTAAKLCFAGVSGNTYTVQASTNLIDWRVVGVAVADSNGVCEFEDPDSTKFPCRYYRIVVP